MLNTIIFIGHIPADKEEAMVHHGSSYRFIHEAIAGNKWHFGSTSNYEKDGEGLQYPGEREAIDEFFQLDPLVSEIDALSSQQIHSTFRNSHKDVYNSCWSISIDVALSFAKKYHDGVVVSMKASALASRVKNLAGYWTEKSNAARMLDFESLSSGDPDGIPETGWGAIHASAAFMKYLPMDYQHRSSGGDGDSTGFMSPVHRNMRLPESYRGIDLASENEFRLSLNLSNSDGCLTRNPTGVGNVLAPMITQANATSGHHGLWLHGLSINTVESFRLIPAVLY